MKQMILNCPICGGSVVTGKCMTCGAAVHYGNPADMILHSGKPVDVEIIVRGDDDVTIFSASGTLFSNLGMVKLNDG